jgi:DNA-binding helix-hairpin-helix protein with protein kinase domain
MTASNLFDHLGRPLTLGTELGKGGEGRVFNVANFPDLVAKVYHKPPPAHREAKLRAMLGLAREELYNVAAWPTATLHERPRGPVRGLVMRKIKGFKEVHFLYSPAHRKTAFPHADWRFLVHTAMNCAAAFDTAHGCGVVVGDVNQSNVLVSAQGLIALIDCDSYQVQLNGQSYPCEVGVDLFTPPELQGRSFRGLLRTPNHDRFGLAVLIFYLLFMNRHPFAGRYLGPGDMLIDQAIRQFRFAYSRVARTYLMQTPLHALPLSAVSSQLVDLFERAFGRGSDQANARPAPSEWVTALKTFLGSLRPCTSDSGHVYPPHLPNCPWCGLIRQGAPNFFISVAYFRRAGAPAQAGPVFVLATVWARIEQVPSPSTTYRRPAVPAVSSPTPWPSSVPRSVAPCPTPPAILTSPPAPPALILPTPAPPALILPTPAPPAFNVPPPRRRRVTVPEDRRQKIIRITAIACALAFSPLCLCGAVLGTLAPRGPGLGGSVIGVIALFAALFCGAWWWMLESVRRRKECELKQEYEEEVAAWHAAARQHREAWERQLAALQRARARQQREAWERQLALQQAEARQQREAWERQLALQQARARQQREAWERQLALQQAEAQRRYDEEVLRWKAVIEAIRAEVRRRRQARDDAEHRVKAAEQNWASAASRFKGDFDRKKGELVSLRQRHDELAHQYTVERHHLQGRVRESQLEDFLQQQFISDHDIPGIGPMRTAALASFGIETAFDVHQDSVLQVPGFGPALTQRLVAWRQDIVSRFAFTPAVGVPAHEQQALDMKYAQARQQVESKLLAGEGELRAITMQAESELRRLYGPIQSCLQQLAQAELDLKVIPQGV